MVRLDSNMVSTHPVELAQLVALAGNLYLYDLHKVRLRAIDIALTGNTLTVSFVLVPTKWVFPWLHRG